MERGHARSSAVLGAGMGPYSRRAACGAIAAEQKHTGRHEDLPQFKRSQESAQLVSTHNSHNPHINNLVL